MQVQSLFRCCAVMTYLIRFHLQTGRGLVEDMIPPVECELLSFLVANLQTRDVQEVTNGKRTEMLTTNLHHCTLTPPLSHFTLTLIASDMPFSARPSPLPEDRVDRVKHLRLPYHSGV